jgi:hypothetical protein
VLAELLVCLIHCYSNFPKAFQGGFACGNAIGNTYGWGDESMADPPALRQKGKVVVYISSDDPSTILPTETRPSSKKLYQSLTCLSLFLMLLERNGSPLKIQVNFINLIDELILTLSK